MKLKYPLLISVAFIMLVVLNNEWAKWKTYHFYAEATNVDDPIRHELQQNELLKNEASAPILVINLWATWCVPCQKEIPLLNQLVDKYDSEQILFLSITGEEEKEVQKWIDLQKEEPAYYPIYNNQRLIEYLYSLNPDPTIKKGQAPERLPTNLIIAKGKVIYFHQGFSEENIAQMDSVLEKIASDI